MFILDNSDSHRNQSNAAKAGIDLSVAKSGRVFHSARIRRDARERRIMMARKSIEADLSSVSCNSVSSNCPDRQAMAATALLTLQRDSSSPEEKTNALKVLSGLLNPQNSESLNPENDEELCGIIGLCEQRNLQGVLNKELENISIVNVDLLPRILALVGCVNGISRSYSSNVSNLLVCIPHLRRLLKTDANVLNLAICTTFEAIIKSDKVSCKSCSDLGVFDDLISILGRPFVTDELALKRSAILALKKLLEADQPVRTLQPCNRGVATLLGLANIFFVEHKTLENDIQELLVEVFWCVALLSAKQEVYRIALIEAQALTAFLEAFLSLVNCQKSIQQFDIRFLTPLLRILANLLTLLHGNMDNIEARFEPLCSGLATLLSADCVRIYPCLTKDSLKAVASACTLEASWKVRSRSASPKLSAKYFLDSVCRLIKHSSGDDLVECFYTLQSLVSLPYFDVFVRIVRLHPHVMVSVVDCLSARDEEVVICSLNIMEMAFRKLNNPFSVTSLGGVSGSQILSRFNAMEALQTLHYNEAIPWDQRSRAKCLLDKHFREPNLSLGFCLSTEDEHSNQRDENRVDMCVNKLTGSNEFGELEGPQSVVSFNTMSNQHKIRDYFHPRANTTMRIDY